MVLCHINLKGRAGPLFRPQTPGKGWTNIATKMAGSWTKPGGASSTSGGRNERASDDGQETIHR